MSIYGFYQNLHTLFDVNNASSPKNTGKQSTKDNAEVLRQQPPGKGKTRMPTVTYEKQNAPAIHLTLMQGSNQTKI